MKTYDYQDVAIRKTHLNNFDFLRLIFASFVIISHSYFLLNLGEEEPLFVFSKFMVFSGLGVYGFFVISGYLIHQSLSRSKSIKAFIRNRIKRIVPGLWFVILLSVIIVGPWQTIFTTLDYFKCFETWQYLFYNSFLIPFMPSLPGVFRDNPFGSSVNGSLWTLRYEFLFYGLILFLFQSSSYKKKIILGTISFLSYLIFILMKKYYFSNQLQYHLLNLFLLSALFSSGSFWSLFENWIIKFKTRICIITAIIFFLGLFLLKNNIICMLSFPLLILSFGKSYFPILHFSKYIGDISYGTYIYAFPIQQILISQFNLRQPLELLLYSLILSWTFGYLSWQLIEKQFLKKKLQLTDKKHEIHFVNKILKIKGK